MIDGLRRIQLVPAVNALGSRVSNHDIVQVRVLNSSLKPAKLFSGIIMYDSFVHEVTEATDTNFMTHYETGSIENRDSESNADLVVGKMYDVCGRLMILRSINLVPYGIMIEGFKNPVFIQLNFSIM